jgi:hypothetical protein
MPGNWNDLTTNPVDGIGMEYNITNLNGNTSHIVLS